MLAAIDRVLAPLTWLVAAFAVAVLLWGPELIGAKAEAPAPPSGETVFADAGCGGCHTLAAAGSSGATGPNLDELAPDVATVEAAVTSGAGSMPSFADSLSGAEIRAVAEYVSTSAGGG